MAYTLRELTAPDAQSPTNGAGLSRSSKVLGRLRASVQADVDRKFHRGDPTMMAASAARAFHTTLDKAQRQQAQIEGQLFEHAVAGAPVNIAYREIAKNSDSTIPLVQSVAEKMAFAEEISVGKRLGLPGIEIPELDPEPLALDLARLLHRGSWKVLELGREVQAIRRQLEKNPFLNIVEHDGASYVFVEALPGPKDRLNSELLGFAYRNWQRRPGAAVVSERILLTLFTGEPSFPKEYVVQAPDFVPDDILKAADHLHYDAIQWNLLDRPHGYRPTFTAERLLSTLYGRPFASRACPDYDEVNLDAPQKKPGVVWEENRELIQHGIALDILRSTSKKETELQQQVEALVQVAQGKDRYHAEKIRTQLSAPRLSDSALNRLMILAGRQGLMGTTLASHYRVFKKGAQEKE